MPRPPLPLGTWGRINRTEVAPGRWRARAQYRDYDGVTRPVERFGPSGAKAERALVEALSTRGRVQASTADIVASTTLATLSQAWLSQKRKQNLAPSTLELYEQTIRVHITPAVGDVRVGELTVGGAERFIESKGQTAVAQRCRIILSGMMALAAQHDAIERNPVRDTSTVKRERKKPRALTVDELAILRRRIGSYAGGNVGHGPPRALDLPELFEFWLGTGGRINEALPARWADVDWGEPPTLTLHRSKGGANDLILTLPTFVMAALRRQRARDLPGDFIFPSRAGTVRSAANVRRQLREARKHVVIVDGKPDGPADMFEWVTPHSLRRTVGTIVADEYGPDVAAEQLGNTREVLERHYRQRRSAAPDVTSALDVLAPIRSV